MSAASFAGGRDVVCRESEEMTRFGWRDLFEDEIASETLGHGEIFAQYIRRWRIEKVNSRV